MQATMGAERDRMATRAVSAATIGTALEWFDFTLYGAVSATVLPKLFFPTMDATTALLASLATFGVGLGARPLGAIICGQLGDKLGRRNLLLGTVTVMGLASVLIGLLPTYASIGVWAPILLVTLRIIQGFALGGESTGAQLMALEHAHPDRRGKYSGLLGTCSPLSQIMANAVLFLLSSTLTAADFESYGWRIPFILSFILVAVGLYIRLKVSETPAFVALEQTKVAEVGSPLRDAIRLHWREVLRWMFFFCGPAAIFYLIVVYSLSYVTGPLGMPKQTGFALLMGANVCAIVGAMAGGLLSDRIGRKYALMRDARHPLHLLSDPGNEELCPDADHHGIVPRLHAIPERHSASRVCRGIPDKRALFGFGARLYWREPDCRWAHAGACGVACQPRRRLALGRGRSLRRLEPAVPRDDFDRTRNARHRHEPRRLRAHARR
jgi:MFS family permease